MEALSSSPHTHSQLFLVRLWVVVSNDDQVEWHGKVQHIMSGEAHSFCDWPMLIDLLIDMLQALISSQTEEQAHMRIVRSRHE